MARPFGDTGAEYFTLATIVSAFVRFMLDFSPGRGFRMQWRVMEISFGFAKRIQPRFHRPSGAIAFQGSVAILLVLTGTHQELYSYRMFGISTFSGLAAVALIRLRYTEPFHVWGCPWTPLIFAIAAFRYLYKLMADQTRTIRPSD